MVDRSRALVLAQAVLCFVAFALLGLAVAQDWGPLREFDHRGDPREAWSVGQPAAREVLRWIEVAFGTLAMTIYTTVLTVVLFVRGYRRAAYFTAGVMISTSLTTSLVKSFVDRDRPAWQDPLHLYENPAFPSGHASGITAFAGIVIVLVTMLVRRAVVRRLAVAAAVLTAVVVCLDRILLGRHYPSDVIGGILLGVGMVLLWLVLFSPLPRSHAESAPPLPEARPSAHQLAVIVNPVKVEDAEQFRATVTSMAIEAGWSTPTWHYTTVEDPGTGMAHSAAVEGADLVVVCGGDGTVREVCAELAGTGIPVGIVPAGTGNLLARNLHIPLYLRAAIDVALNGQDRAIDLVEVSGDGLEATHFMVMAGMGLDAAMMEGVNEGIKKKVGWLAYVLSGAKALMFPAERIDISVDDGEFTRHRARTVVVGNVGFLQAGMPLLPDAVIDDGLLDVVVLHPKSFFSWIPLAWRVVTRTRRTDETINRMTGRTVVLRAHDDVPRQLDGDAVGPGRELRMECVHGRLLVRVPR